MTPRDPVLWLPSALLLLQIPASFPLSGPSTVKGIVGESLSLQCRYEEKFKANNKFWCRYRLRTLCDKIVKTTDSEREVQSGRVSISDHPARLTFTVTLERLALEDAGTYLCGVDAPWLDYTSKVRVSVFPAPTAASSPEGSTQSPGPRTSLSALTRPRTSLEDTPGPSPQPRSLLSSVCFMVLVFLEVPLLLGMLSAVLWVSWPQRCSGGRRGPSDYENQ